MNPNDRNVGKEFRNRILVGNALSILKNLPRNSIDCCVTSPPFFKLRSYGKLADTIWGGKPHCRHEWAKAGKTNGSFCRRCNGFKGQLGQEPTIELYTEHLVEIFNEVRRVLTEHGTLWLNLADTYYSTDKCQPHHFLKPKDLCGTPWVVALALRQNGWYLRSDIVWYKPNCLPESIRDRPTRAHEYVFLLAKSRNYYYDAHAIREQSSQSSIRRLEQKGGAMDYVHGVNPGHSARRALENFTRNPGSRNKRSVWTIPTQPYRGAHFAVFPEELARSCILAGCPEWVCSRCGKPRVKILKTRVLDMGRTCADKTADEVNASRTSALRFKHKKTLTQVTGYTHCHCRARHRKGIVLDVFAGAGTTALAARKLNRDYTCVEINPAYVRLANERIQRERIRSLGQHHRMQRRGCR